MKNSAVLSNWCIDAFDCLSSKIYSKLSFEQISRIDSFISAVILFEEVYLSENYTNNRIIKELNRAKEGTIKIVEQSKLLNSTDMTINISIDANLYYLAFEELAKENNLWQIQHDPDIGFEIVKNSEDDVNIREMLENKFFTQLRLWHWCYTNEMAEVTNSVNIIPMSLKAVAELSHNQTKLTDVVVKNYIDYAKFHNQRFIRMSETISTPFISEIKHVPPLMSLLLSRCRSSEDMVTVLTEMRNEFSEFRKLRHEFTNKVVNAENIGEQEEIVADWNRAWETLTAGEFKKPNLLKRKITSTDISTSIASIESGGLKTIIKNLIDHHQYKKAHKQFQIYSDVHEHINNIDQNRTLLTDKFGIEGIIPIKLKL